MRAASDRVSEVARPPDLSMRDVRVVRGRREVLRVPALDVAPGETLALLGPNGAGKSTLLLAAALLLPVAAGRIELFGERPAGRRQRVRLRRATATVFQESGLLDMSVRDNLLTALRLHGTPAARRRARADRWLDRLGVLHLAGTRPHQLSGGEAQRASLARAFATRPRLLFLDEPFSSLDPATRAALVGDLRALLRDEGLSALLATHDHTEAHLLADRAMVLLDGEPVQQGQVDEVFARPADGRVAAFLGFGVVEAQSLRALIGLDPGPAGEAFVPPGAIALAGDSAGPGLPARIVAVQGALGQGRVVLDVGPRLTVDVPVERVRRDRLAPGSEVRVTLDPERVIWPSRPAG